MNEANRRLNESTDAIFMSAVDELVSKQKNEIGLLRTVIASTLSAMADDDQYVVSAYTPLLSKAIGVPDPLQWFHDAEAEAEAEKQAGKRLSTKKRRT